MQSHRIQSDQVKSQWQHHHIDHYKLSIPKYLNTGDKVEFFFRKKYPGIQIRFAGLGYGKFPHKERIPYIMIRVDGASYPIDATLVLY